MANELERKVKPILCLDFDGVLHSYSSGWKGVDVIPDPPTLHAMRFLSDAVAHFRVAIFSSRSGQHGGIQAMRFWLRLWLTNELDQDLAESVYSQIEWPTEKPPAFVGIDDRVLTFDGVWPSIDTLRDFAPWNKGGESSAALLDRKDVGEMRDMIEKHARWADGIRSAVETNQVADKDVRGLAITMRDEMRQMLERMKL